MVKKKKRHQREHSRAREEHDVSAHDSGDGSACTNRRKPRTPVHRDLRQARTDATYEVKPEISQMAQAVLHVAAKDPQEKHVAKDVQKAPVEKHARHQREKRETRLRSGMSQRSLRPHRNHAELPNQQISSAGRERKLISEHQSVRYDQQDVDDRKCAARRFAA
jgi:hypothetical protein